MTHLRPVPVLAAVLGVLTALLVLVPSAQAAVGATVTGRVVDLSGRPVVDVTVYAAKRVSDPFQSYYEQVGRATTDGAGQYRLAVEAGVDEVRVCVPGPSLRVTRADAYVVGRCFGSTSGRGGDPYVPFTPADAVQDPEDQGRPVSVRDGRTTSGIDVAVSPPGRLRGVVQTSDGQPVVGRAVTVRATSGCEDTCTEVVNEGTTDYLGRYDVAITRPVASPDTYCLLVEGAPIRHGSVRAGRYDCSRSLKIGQVVDEAPTVLASGAVTKVNTPYWVGSAKVGWTLSARPGTWNPGDVDLAYAWFDGTRRLGTGSTYFVTAAELGHRITLRTTASASGYTPAVVDYTRPETTVEGDIHTRRDPTISGSVKVGKTLTASASTPAPTATITYRWLRQGEAIPGATKARYTLTKADRGRRISVAVTYTKTGYHTLTCTSALTAKVK